MLDFRRWLVEVGTGTNCVAAYPRPALPMVRRGAPEAWGEEDPFFKKRKRGTTRDADQHLPRP